MIKSIFFIFLGMLGTVLFCAVFIFIFANSIEMNCARQADHTLTCTIEKRLLGKVKISQSQVSGVNGARVDQSCDNDGCSYRAELTTRDGGSTPVNDVYSDFDPAKQTATQINDFMASGGTSLKIDQPLQWWVVFLIGGLGLMGLVLEAGAIFGQAFRWYMRRS